jgi:PAS domain S-box-containing protein
MITERLKRISNHFLDALEKKKENSFEISPIPENGNDEIALLAKSFNNLIRTLNELYQSLEAKVEDRTKELWEANVRLIKEVNEKVSAEKRLKEAEEKYRTVFEHTGAGTIIIDEDGTIILSNTEFQRLISLSRHEIEGKKKWTDFIHPDDLAKVSHYRNLHKENHRDRPQQFQFRLMNNNGKIRYVICNMEAMPGTKKIISSIIDITKQKETKELLKKERERFMTFIEEAPLGIGFIDADGRYTYINPRFTEIFGYTLDEIPTGRDWFNKAYPDRITRTQAISSWINDTRGMKVGQSVSRIYNVTCKDGETKTVNFIVVKLKANEFCIIYEDITEKRMLEAQLIHSQKMESIGTLAGGIAHDFNNLVQAILGYTQILLLDPDQDKDTLAKLKGIERAAKRASELTNQLLTFSRKVESKLRPVDINKEIQEVQKLMRRIIPRMIEIEFHPCENIRLVNADPAQIEQVVLNLAVNARDAMPDGGKLIIETENVVLNQAYCRSHLGALPGEYVLISITDTGCGMDSETMEHIFEPFYTTKEMGKGTGLGLATVYGIIKNHNGYIMCYSEVGKGTTFKIYLPAIDGSHQSSNDDEDISGINERGNGETILLVDDDKDIRELGENILRKFGYRVLTASSGEEATRIYKDRRDDISLVILDLIMPGMGGKKTLDQILKLDPNAKVIISSGFSASAYARDAMESGAEGFICKPYNINQLLSVVHDVINNGGASKS